MPPPSPPSPPEPGGSGGSGSGGGGGGGYGGGGGGGIYGGGGGGGYGGGGGGGIYGGGGGGGSYLDPSVTLLIALSSMNSGNGQVDISIATPEPSTWTMMLLGFAGLGYAGYRRARAGSAAHTA
jgi:hypothetical protein